MTDVETRQVIVTGAHPYAEKFPLLPEAELAELAESIRANGLRNPIVVTPDGLILDGRNRWTGCQRTGVVPTVMVYEGDDLAEFVIDANSARRHMSTGARAMATALVLAADGRRNEGRWRRGSVHVGNTESRVTAEGRTWTDVLRQAGVILDHAPDLAEQVTAGTLALDAAYRQAEQRRDADRLRLEEQARLAAEEADARAFIEQSAPDLAAQVGGPFRSFVEARDVWARRNREEAQRLARERAAEERRLREERQARTDRYTGLCRALMTLGAVGGYDVAEFMAEYDPVELDPPQAARGLLSENLRDVIRLAEGLLKWVEAR